MKKLEVYPEWILDNMTFPYYIDGHGNITIVTDSVSDAYWIDLALNTLGVKYSSQTIGYDPDPERQYFEVQWEFNIEAIKDECSNLYVRWKTMDYANSLRLRPAQQLIDNIEVNNNNNLNVTQ